MRKSKIDPHLHVGETHGIYTLIDVLDKKDKHGQYVYVGKCNKCGFVKHSFYGDFTCNIATVCNHVRLGSGAPASPVKWENKRIETIFLGMKRRCYSKNDKSYKWYGQKGIKICNEWLNNPKAFETWSLQNGYKDTLTIDRIDEHKGYCPENCRWVTDVQNAKYKSTTSLINVDGEIHTGRDWSKILGFGINTINRYIRKYGLDNTIEFIRRYLKNPELRLTISNNKNVYKLYMN